MARRARISLRRAGRRTNVALLAALVGAFLSGWAAFAAGTEVPARWSPSATACWGWPWSC